MSENTERLAQCHGTPERRRQILQQHGIDPEKLQGLFDKDDDELEEWCRSQKQ